MYVHHLKKYKNSIRNSSFSREEESVIWDFYVSKSVARSASQRRNLKDYYPPEYKETPLRLDRFLRKANIIDENCYVVKGKNMNYYLEKLNLMNITNSNFDIVNPRIAALFTANSENQDSDDSITCILTHIRNALAHGNTYFFDNGYLFLEDYYRDTITARMLFHRRTLLNWIRLIDKNMKYYPELSGLSI